MGTYVSLQVRNGLAVVTLDAPEEPVNILRREFFRDLESTAEQLARQKGVEATVVFSAKTAGFIAGADIKEIEEITDPEQASALAAEGQKIFALWSALPIPVVAAVHGKCLGGGVEFALACHFRIGAADAEFSLPEIRLGIFPGFGGTQRLPRLISLERALDLILTGRTIRSQEALDIGLLDRIAPSADLRAEAEALARQAASDRRELLMLRRRKKSGLRSFLLERNPIGRRLLCQRTRKKVREKTGGHYPAPLEAIEVIRQGLSLPLQAGLAIEARTLGPVLTGPVCKNLLHVFQLSQQPKKRIRGDEPPPLRTLVLGAGIMGGGIAQLLTSRKIPVLLKDVRPEAVNSALRQVRDGLRRQAGKRGEDEGWVAAHMALISGSIDYENLEKIDLVIEAVVEKMEVKQKVMRETEPLLRPDAVFATNTSALSVSELQAEAERPERIGGLHFFNPVDRMPLVEVVRGEKTAEATIDYLFAQSLRLGKIPILTADRPGFLVNRLLMAFLNEACLIAESGVDRNSLDRAVTDFGLPMGPFRLLDEVGIDIAAEVGRTLCLAYPYLRESGLLSKAIKSGLLGKKGGRGFYLYRDGKPFCANPEADRRLQLKSRRAAIESDLWRMLYLMVNEAARCQQEGVIAGPADIDAGMVFGSGFPPFRGGLCRWADQVGRKSIIEELELLAAAHGPRFEPSRLLRQNSSFYTEAAC